MAEEEKKTKSKSKVLIILFTLIVLVLAGIAAWSFYQYLDAQKQIAKLSTIEGQQKLAQKEVDQLLTQVKKHMVLPEKEKPTIATVTDVNALKKNQPFFEKAQNGDKVIVYVQARKAIIYSPQKDVIVNVGAVAVEETGNTANGDQTSSVNVEIRNGTATSGLARTVGNALAADKRYKITAISDSAKKDYEKTIIVDFGKSDNPSTIATLAQALSAQVVKQLPEGEKSSNAEVLIIVGADQQ